jgi:hypothetical protein
MLLVAAAFKGYAIKAQDGKIGVVADFLFDDRSWKLRWLVIDTGSWLSARKVLVHPSAIVKSDYDREELAVALTMTQVEESPDISADAPVSRQMELSLYDYYGWNPIWGGGGLLATGDGIGAGAIGSPLSSPPFFTANTASSSEEDEHLDPHLRSVSAVIGYHVHATDGTIGHIENLLIDDKAWAVQYMIIDTKNWWPGQHVLLSPYAVSGVSWEDREIRLNVLREKVKTAPPWNPDAMIEQAYAEGLHHHYNWPGQSLY